MLTPSIIPNAPLGHPVKSPVPATHADETTQASESAGFGRLLAKEMGNKPDVSQTGPADASTSAQTNEN
ncbi:MAG: hypothetical protein KGM95_01540, partial [Betaproteobacteria bacterium]|nr:hypothetical protein [Betaproteobacteria bacterium]